MTGFRVFLVVLLVLMAGYTIVVVANHGMGLFPIFFGDIAALTWPGQFNADFLCFLLLSGLWLAWRNEFSPAGIALGAIGVVGGAPLLFTYLLIVSFTADGDIRVIMLGRSRASG